MTKKNSLKSNRQIKTHHHQKTRRPAPTPTTIPNHTPQTKVHAIFSPLPPAFPCGGWRGRGLGYTQVSSNSSSVGGGVGTTNYGSSDTTTPAPTSGSSGGGGFSLNFSRPGSRTTSAPSSPSKTRESFLQVSLRRRGMIKLNKKRWGVGGRTENTGIERSRYKMGRILWNKTRWRRQV